MMTNDIADRQYMGTAADAKAGLIEKATAWRKTRQPSMATAAEHRSADNLEHQIRFELANAAMLWLWHEENPTPATRSPADTEGARLANWLADYSDDCVENGDNLDAEQISKAAQWIADHLTPTVNECVCLNECLALNAAAGGGDAQVTGMIDTDDEEQVERSNSRIAELLRERDALVKAMEEIVRIYTHETGRERMSAANKIATEALGKAPQP